ncbi:Fic family protein [Sphingobium sp. CR2-8]|uniref:Fic family protein n=1 Tax=Sphingobium sp. CR2-8 TaxID=1306534 RepID=UPI002DB94136|nr:Fic family protein [Sphingobium sp. CR2-8]MEC3909647.1 Fic family protein [Sphingobium sp. CR2-8]
MSEGQRHSIAADATLIDDPDEVAVRESENAVAQFDRVLDMVDEIARGTRPFRLRASMILDLHRIALDGLSAYAGNYRPADIEIGQSKHIPPAAHLVPSLIEEMCEYVMDNAETSEALHLCAYVMWRLNWIHPFTDGNGRTSRALAYYVLCGKVGYLLPGSKTVPEQIAADRTPYYQALENADKHLVEGKIDLTALEMLLDKCLATQLLSAYNDAKDPAAGSPKDRKLH